MRVLLTTDTVGGVWTFTRELAGGLLERGHAVALVSFGRVPSDAQAGWVQRTETCWGERFCFVASEAPLEWMEGNAATFTEGAEVLRRVAAKFNPEVVHASQFCWGALDSDTPIVVTAHSDVLSWAEVCRPEGLQDSDWLRTYVRLVTNGLLGADAVVAPTRWMAEALGRHFPVRPKVLRPDALRPGARIVPNGVAAIEEKSKPREMRAICVGRMWDEGKGMALLAEGGWPMPVVLAGEDQFEDGRRAAIGGVCALGMLGEAELRDAMRASAVYVCCSIYEPFGLAAVEAGLSGCAVVCRDISSLREVWGDAALYFGNGDELRRVLRSLKEDPELLRRRRAAARERAKRYPVAEMVEGYVQVYREVMAGRPRDGVERDAGWVRG